MTSTCAWCHSRVHFLMPTLSTFPTEKNIGNNTLFRYSLSLALHTIVATFARILASKLPWITFASRGWSGWRALSESLGRQQTRTQNGHLQLNSSGGINAHWLCALPLLYQRVYFSTLRNRKTLETTQCFATFSTFASPGWIGWRAGETRSRVTIKCDPLG